MLCSSFYVNEGRQQQSRDIWLCFFRFFPLIPREEGGGGGGGGGGEQRHVTRNKTIERFSGACRQADRLAGKKKSDRTRGELRPWFRRLFFQARARNSRRGCIRARTCTRDPLGSRKLFRRTAAPREGGRLLGRTRAYARYAN